MASGDPLGDRVIVWTRINTGADADVRWEVALTPAFDSLVAAGTQRAVRAHDHTVKVDVTGLSPATTYYYRFRLGAEYSLTGRTRTAPVGGAASARLAVLSCTSYWSSWWSGLGHIADRDDLDLVVHLGDYIYDFVDKDEQVRSRVSFDDMAHPDNRDWTSVDECRRRYALWRSDLNLLRAHQQHPWAMVWDNHDLDPEFGNELPIPGMENARSSTSVKVCASVYFEWTPTRPVRGDGSGRSLLITDGSYPAPEDPLLIYRTLRYGDLLDLILTDGQSRLPTYGLPVDASHLAGAPSVLGRAQFEWLGESLRASARDGVRWRVIGSQTVFAPIDIPDLQGPGDLPKLGISRWAKYPVERDRVLEVLAAGGAGGSRITRNLVLSGDTHCNLGADVIPSPALTSSTYVAGPVGAGNRAGAQPAHARAGAARLTTGNGEAAVDPAATGAAAGSAAAGSAVLEARNRRRDSVAVEFAPSSMGRGGADDQIAGILAGSAGSSIQELMPQAQGLAGVAELAIAEVSRNVQFIDWCEHGYGIVDLNHERAIAEWWWQNKFVANSPDVLGYQYVSWAEENEGLQPPRYPDQFDDVRLHGLEVAATAGAAIGVPAPR